jgi:hypothetical protein
LTGVSATYPVRDYPTSRRLAISLLRSSRGLLTATLTLLSGSFQLAVALIVNLDLSACKHVFRSEITRANPT